MEAPRQGLQQTGIARRPRRTGGLGACACIARRGEATRGNIGVIEFTSSSTTCECCGEMLLAGQAIRTFGEVERAELGASPESKPIVFCSRQYWGLGERVHER